MKEIRMDYSEYEMMIQTMKNQKEVIDEFKKDSRVVLIDNRYFHGTANSFLNYGCPKVIADENLAKEYLQQEFDALSEHLVEARSTIVRMQEETWKKPKKEKKSSWWSF